jgi:uncharacterized protein (DUF488 family)
MNAPTLYTIGYEGQDIHDFISIIDLHQIKRIIDVRRNPISRKFGFSKRRLQELLAANNIDYIHIVELGTPKLVRADLKVNKDYTAFFSAFDEYLAQQSEPLQRAIDLAREKPSAILCFEREHSQCHRFSVANAMAQQAGLTVEHIAV